MARARPAIHAPVSDSATPAANALPEAGVSDARDLDTDLLLMCGLAWAAGLIHVQAAIDHLSENRLYAICFIMLTAAQIAWGIALYRSPRRSLLIAGAIGSLGVLAVWILSRTSGLPIGPERGVPEQLGLLDCVASADEIALVLLVVLQLRPRRLESEAGGLARLLRAGLVVLILLSSLVLGGGAHAH